MCNHRHPFGPHTSLVQRGDLRKVSSLMDNDIDNRDSVNDNRDSVGDNYTEC